MQKKYISDFSEGRTNNFDFLRFFFASLVILSHSYAVLYKSRGEDNDLLSQWTHRQAAFGGLAVDGFFLISGFLITRSWLYSKGTWDYARKRLLRIMPALIVVMLMTVFVLGPIATTDRATYFTNHATYKYLLVMFKVSLHNADKLPGVFASNPMQDRVNGPLWTIRCEMLCYALVAVFGLLGMYRNRRSILAVALVGAALVNFRMQILGHLHLPVELQDSLRVLVYFLIGMAYFMYRDRIPYSPIIACACVLGLIAADLIRPPGVMLVPFVMPICMPYLLFYVAFNSGIKLQRFARRGDLSYGIYLYAFPIQQLLVSRYLTSLTPLTLTLSAFLLACACAALSWQFVEKPALDLKKKSRPEPSVHFAPAAGETPAGQRTQQSAATSNRPQRDDKSIEQTECTVP